MYWSVYTSFLVLPSFRIIVLFCVAGVRPGSRACSLVRPEGRTFRIVGPVGHDLYVEVKVANNGRAL
jgi:hypothetical protein